jgi:hypothetical protein
MYFKHPDCGARYNLMLEYVLLGWRGRKRPLEKAEI